MKIGCRNGKVSCRTMKVRCRMMKKRCRKIKVGCRKAFVFCCNMKVVCRKIKERCRRMKEGCRKGKVLCRSAMVGWCFWWVVARFLWLWIRCVGLCFWLLFLGCIRLVLCLRCCMIRWLWWWWCVFVLQEWVWVRFWLCLLGCFLWWLFLLNVCWFVLGLCVLWVCWRWSRLIYWVLNICRGFFLCCRGRLFYPKRRLWGCSFGLLGCFGRGFCCFVLCCRFWGFGWFRWWRCVVRLYSLWLGWLLDCRLRYLLGSWGRWLSLRCRLCCLLCELGLFRSRWRWWLSRWLCWCSLRDSLFFGVAEIDLCRFVVWWLWVRLLVFWDWLVHQLLRGRHYNRWNIVGCSRQFEKSVWLTAPTTKLPSVVTSLMRQRVFNFVGSMGISFC